MLDAEPVVAAATSDDQAPRAALAAPADQVARREATLAAVGIATWEWDLATHQVTWSPGAEALFGLRVGELEATYAAFLRNLHHADRDAVELAIAEALSGAAEYTVEHRVVWPDGTVHWLGGRGQVARDGEGRPLSLAGAIYRLGAAHTPGAASSLTRGEDAGAQRGPRRDAEAALRARERRFRAMVENAFGAIMLADARGSIVYASPNTSSLFGRTSEQVVGHSALANLHPDDVAGAQSLLQRLLAQPRERLTFQCRVQHENGTWRRIELTAANYLDDADIASIVCNYHDVTERLVAEEALRESESRYRALVDHAPEGILVCDLDAGRFADLNRNAERLFGLPRDALLPHTLLTLSAPVQPDGNPSPLLLGTLEAQALAGQTVRLEWVFLDAAHREIVCEMHLTRLPAGGRRLVRASLVDITERKHLEAQLRQAQRMEAVGQLAGGVAHDFNNLLTVINGFSDLLAEELAESDPRREYVLEIGRAGARAAELTHQLLAFSRRQLLQPTILDLNTVLSDLRPMLRRLIEEHIDLQLLLAPGVGLVKVDAGQLEQVVVNLAVNARDAMPGGGVLALETANVTVDSKGGEHPGVAPGEYVRLTVSDTGRGMDAATRARIFEPFFTTKEVGQGTGLGLSTVYGIVKQSHGFVAVRSEPGQGSAFQVYLPRVQEAPRPAPPVPQAAVAGGSETILLVEDADGPRALARQALCERGYHVLEASQPSAALAASAAHDGTIHLLLTDVVLPEMSGHALAERLRVLRPGLRVLYTTGYLEDTIGYHGVHASAVALLQKPYTVLALSRAVREALDAPEPGPRVG